MNAFEQEPSAFIEHRQPRKRALLIGIQYENDTLPGPHQDVMRMRNLLTSKYGYDDVVVMIDESGIDLHLFPDRSNIIRELRNLVSDAGKGDRLFLHYSGHVTQRENRRFTEEDGLDECIVARGNQGEDIDKWLIRDNLLRQILVDSLPSGCKLFAIFDSCHSASLLDLPHFRCNRIYVPWMSKGRRRSDSRRRTNVRRGALVKTHAKAALQQTVVTHAMNIVHCDDPGNEQCESSENVDCFFEFIKRCDSPDAVWPCDGNCSRVLADGDTSGHAQVVALAACKDSQYAWDVGDGSSLTSALINYLEMDPYPTLKTLLAAVSYDIHKDMMKIHQHAQEQRRSRRIQELQLKPSTCTFQFNCQWSADYLEMHNFQDPQLSSILPLNMDSKLDI